MGLSSPVVTDADPCPRFSPARPPLTDVDGGHEVEPLSKDSAFGNKVEDGSGIVVAAAAWHHHCPKALPPNALKLRFHPPSYAPPDCCPK